MNSRVYHNSPWQNGPPFFATLTTGRQAGNREQVHNICVDSTTQALHNRVVTSLEFKRWLQKQGCRFEPGKGGHLLVRLGDRKAVLPMHGSKHEIPKGTAEAIRKQLGLK